MSTVEGTSKFNLIRVTPRDGDYEVEAHHHEEILTYHVSRLTINGWEVELEGSFELTAAVDDETAWIVAEIADDSLDLRT